MRKPSGILQLLREILLRPGVIVVSALYALLQLASNLIAWTLPAEEQAKYQFIKLLNWRIWLIATPFLTIVLIGLIIRTAYKVIGKKETEHDVLISRIVEENKAEIERKEKQHQLDQNKLIEGHVSTETALMKLRETEVEGLKKNFKSILDANTEQAHKQKERYEEQVSKLLHKIKEQSEQIEKLKQHKLELVVDESSQVRFEGKRLVVELRIQFINSDDLPLHVYDLRTSLLEAGTEKTVSSSIQFKRCYEEPSMEPLDFKNGLKVSERTRTPYYWFTFFLEIPSENNEQLTSNHFLRTTMDAMRQAPLSIDFTVNDWEGIHQCLSNITLVTSTSLANQDVYKS